MPRGRKLGQMTPGSFVWRLTKAKPGQRIWIEGRSQRSVSGDVLRAGIIATTRTFYALHPGTKEVVELVCVDVQQPGTPSREGQPGQPRVRLEPIKRGTK